MRGIWSWVGPSGYEGFELAEGIMKQTILFSNIENDIFDISSVDKCKFYEVMAQKLRDVISSDSKLIYIPAPLWEGVEDRFFETIRMCFKKAGINFSKIERLLPNSKVDLTSISDDTVLFLMGGSPLSQMKFIKDNSLIEMIKNHQGPVIGFCAGAINLSKYSIITSDDDFPEPQSYQGIGRVDISVEPHFVADDSEFVKNRVKEINGFAHQYNTKIYVIPDDGFIYCEGDNIEKFGDIVEFGGNDDEK